MDPAAEVDGSDTRSLAADLTALRDRALTAAPDVHLVFVTNLQAGPVTDLGPSGVINTAQHYSRDQADEIIRSLQDLGPSVTSFFDEASFLRWLSDPDRRRRVLEVVFTTAEGGSGSGRRALIPAACALFDLPVFNSGAHACSIARHKFHAHVVLKQAGVLVPDTWMHDGVSWFGGLAPTLGTRLILKPAFESMCIGIDAESVRIVDESFNEVILDYFERFRQPVIAQSFITGQEIGVPLVRSGRTRALPIIEFTRADGSPFGALPKTFDDEVVRHDTDHTVPNLPRQQYQRLQDQAVSAFDALGMSGVGRIDFRVDADGRGWVFDTNESPPPLARTVFSRSMELLGFGLRDMLAIWLGVCLEEHALLP